MFNYVCFKKTHIIKHECLHPGRRPGCKHSCLIMCVFTQLRRSSDRSLGPCPRRALRGCAAQRTLGTAPQVLATLGGRASRARQWQRLGERGDCVARRNQFVGPPAASVSPRSPRKRGRPRRCSRRRRSSWAPSVARKRGRPLSRSALRASSGVDCT